MAERIYNNSDGGNPRDGTVSTNWFPEIVPIAGDRATFTNDELDLTGGELPTVMPPVELADIRVADPYTLAGGVAGDLTDFTAAGDCTWVTFTIFDTTLKTPNGAEILDSGTLQGGGVAGILDTEVPVTTGGNCTIDWDLLDIEGGLNASHTVTHANGAGSTLTCDVEGPLNMGAAADTGVAVDIQPATGTNTVTLTADLWSGDFTRTLGEIVPAGFTIHSSGDISQSGGTGNPLFRKTGTGGTIDWNNVAERIASFTMAAGATITDLADRVYTSRLIMEANSEIHDAGIDRFLVYATTQADLVIDPTAILDVYFFYTALADHAIGSALCNIHTSGIRFLTDAAADRVVTASGNIETNGYMLDMYGGDKRITLTMGEFSLDVGQIKMGAAAATFNATLNLGSGTHSIESILGNAASLGCAIDFDSSQTTITDAFPTDNITTITSGGCTITDANGITIDSTATNSTTWTLDGNTTLNADLTLQQTAGVTTLDLADNDLTLKVGGSFTHTAGTFTSTTDFASTINAKGQTLTNITADKEMYVVNGIDGGGNTKLNFLAAAGGILGRRNTVGSILR